FRLPTVIEAPVVVTPPWLSLAVTDTANMPSRGYTWTTEAPDAVAPSPRFQVTVRASPLSELALAVKTTAVAPAITVPSGDRERLTVGEAWAGLPSWQAGASVIRPTSTTARIARTRIGPHRRRAARVKSSWRLAAFGDYSGGMKRWAAGAALLML